MITEALTIFEALKTGMDISKYLSNLIFGDKQTEYLRQIATDMKDMKIHIERL